MEKDKKGEQGSANDVPPPERGGKKSGRTARKKALRRGRPETGRGYPESAGRSPAPDYDGEEAAKLWAAEELGAAGDAQAQASSTPKPEKVDTAHSVHGKDAGQQPEGKLEAGFAGDGKAVPAKTGDTPTHEGAQDDGGSAVLPQADTSADTGDAEDDSDVKIYTGPIKARMSDGEDKNAEAGTGAEGEKTGEGSANDGQPGEKSGDAPLQDGEGDKSAENAGNTENGENSENAGDTESGGSGDNAENGGNSGDGGDGDNDGRNSRGMNAFKAIIYTLCIIAISVLLAVGVLYSATDYLGMFRAEKTANVKIPAHATVDQVAGILKQDGIIRSPAVFKFYVNMRHKQGFESGTFTLESDMSYDVIVSEIKNSKNRSTAKVTIPEGYTLQRTAALLEKDGVCSAKDFLAAADSSKLDFDFQSQIPNNKNRFYRLEGYLFPDTYEFYLDQSADSVVEKMLGDFDSRFDDQLRAQAKSSGMTVDQVVTLASIIQTEAGKTSEMAKVSSVFHNRLTKGINGLKLLQSDATVLYGTRDIAPVATAAQKPDVDAYDTYKHEGLPPGPICNPGLAAIKAALSPADTSYFYFVTDKSGNYYYAKTYSTHLRNVKKAEQTGSAAGTTTSSTTTSSKKS